MASPNPLAPDPELVADGRRFLWTAMVFIIATMVASGLAYMYLGGPRDFGRNAVTLGVLTLLGYFLLKGSAWARWLLLAVVLLSILVLIPAFTRPALWSYRGLPATILALSVGLGYVVIAFGLIFSKGVRAFFRARRYRHVFIDEHEPAPPTWHVSPNR